MKTILLMRHAKAEPGTAGQRDYDRVLSGRGTEDAARMGRAIARLSLVPGVIVSSPAARAKETAEGAAKAMGFAGTIKMERALYNAPGDVWISVLRTLPAAADVALVVAHSPGVAEAAALLCRAESDSFDVATGAVLAFDDDAERWRDVGEGGASMRWFLRPKLVERL
jgi:phosphohistidine phosphatase